MFSEKDIEIVNEIINRRITVGENEDLIYGDKNHLIVEKGYHDSLKSLIEEDIQDIVENAVISKDG